MYKITTRISREQANRVQRTMEQILQTADELELPDEYIADVSFAFDEPPEIVKI